MPSPTLTQYQTLDKAYRFFNKELFGGLLPECLIVFEQKGKHTLGYYANERWSKRQGKGKLDEIAINPLFMGDRSDQEIISTLVHEMVHLWQHHYGRPTRNGYHNRQWAARMHAVGLIPSHTGQPGGHETGQQMTHYIELDGPYEKAWQKFSRQGISFGWVREFERGQGPSSPKAKVTYVCPECGLKVWGKPNLRLVCGDCDATLEIA